MRLEAERGRAAEIEVLRGMAHAYGSSPDLREATRSAIQWVQALVGPRASVSVVLPDRTGRLRAAAADGDETALGRKRAARRRSVFEAKTPHRQRLRDPSRCLALLPLVCRGEAVGVLEVVAEHEVVEECWPTLEAVASQVAIAVRNLSRRSGLERRVETLEGAADLVRELVRADTYRGAVRSAVRLCSRLVAAPVAAWLGNGGGELSILSVRGLGSRKRSELRRALPTLPRWDSIDEQEREGIALRFAALAEVREPVAIDGGDALILAGGEPEEGRASLQVVGSLLQDVLGQLHLLERAERRKEHLDLGIALTAHEVKGPLLGAKAAIDSLLTAPGEPPAEQDLLRRSKQELAQLAGLIDALLRWAVGSAPLRRRGIDLVRQVRLAVESCQLGTGQERVRISAPDRLMARVDAKHFRTAVANVVRNALAYSPPSSKVDVSVDSHNGTATVTVRDRGPGVPPAERESIFDPLARGRSGRTLRPGGGLGLFIARRVLEAHGGGIRVEPSRTGATFCLEVPLKGGRQHARAHR